MTRGIHLKPSLKTHHKLADMCAQGGVERNTGNEILSTNNESKKISYILKKIPYLALQAYEKERNIRPMLELMLKEYKALKQLLK